MRHNSTATRLLARQIQLVIGQSALHLDEGQSIKRETCLFYELTRNKRSCYAFLGTVYGSTVLRLVRFEAPTSYIPKKFVYFSCTVETIGFSNVRVVMDICQHGAVV